MLKIEVMKQMALPLQMTAIFISILILQAATRIYAQDGFISLDCGSPPGTNYTQDDINYVSDDSFIDAGVSVDLSGFKNNSIRIYNTRRSFPNNTRNCYTLRPPKGKNNTYLIRAKFLYGDPNVDIPEFHLSFGEDATIWFTFMQMSDPFAYMAPELIHVSTSDFINVCLLNIGHGYPFITTLELRLLDSTMYQNQSGSLSLTYRFNYGTEEEVIRYKDDKYDRRWDGTPGDSNMRTIQASDAVVLKPLSEEKVPLKVMRTAITPINSTDPIRFGWGDNPKDEYIIYIHLAEVEILEDNQKREFDISVNDIWIATVTPSTTITTITSGTLTGSSSYLLRLTRTKNSTLPPILNAVEVYKLKQLLQNQTDDQDAAAIWSIKSTYGLKNLNWQGDPCVLEAWVGLNCSYDAPGVTKIISLNLSSRGLTGEITTALANLTMIKSLDLSYNNLTGNVPKFLAGLKNLRTLKLSGNNFTRPLPAELVAKSKKGLLQLSIEGLEDTISCPNGSCKKNKHKILLVVLILAPIILCILIVAIIVCEVKRRRKRALNRWDEVLPRKKKFTYSQLANITNNFRDVIGIGGSGKVYRGSYEDEQVAVKMLLDQGDEKFQTEVKFFRTINHKNIITLIGYCNDSNHKGFVYEFMAEGSLEEHLFDRSPTMLSWKRRIEIGYGTAEALAHMHHFCMPPIVHRDIKPSNILLSRDFQAKLADFGLSRVFSNEDASPVKTKTAVGTVGYLDPKFFSTNMLTKSDVYSFGVVLLVLITGKQAISNAIHITEWVKSPDREGNVKNVIDPQLGGKFDTEAASKVLKIAIDCVLTEPSKRPTMNDVADDLKQCV